MKHKAPTLFRFLRTRPVPIKAREVLALERTKLANERTLLAYIRASLYLLLGGLALLQLKEFERIQWLGYVALAGCVAFLAIGIFRFVLLKRRLHKWSRAFYSDAVSEAVESTDEKTSTE